MRRQTKRQISQRSAKKSRSGRDGGKPKCVIHTAEEIKGIRQAAATTSEILEAILAGIRPGVALKDLDVLAGFFMRDHSVVSAFKGYLGFPGEICISVNDEVVHGISCRDRIIQLGDIVSVDCGTRCGGYIGDTAKTVSVGPAVGQVANLMAVTEKSLMAGIDVARAGNTVWDIGVAIESILSSASTCVSAVLRMPMASSWFCPVQNVCRFTNPCRAVASCVFASANAPEAIAFLVAPKAPPADCMFFWYSAKVVIFI